MKSLIIGLGYKFTEKNDLTPNEFTFVGSVAQKDEVLSTMYKVKTIHNLTFSFRIKKLDYEKFTRDIESLLFVKDNKVLYPYSTLNKGIYYCDFHNITIEDEEDSYLITVVFQVREG